MRQWPTLDTPRVSPHVHRPGTRRTIQLGNFLHKTAVLSGLGALAAHVAHAPGLRVTAPLGATAAAAAFLYNVLMHPDPLAQYQVDEDGDDARVIPASRLRAGADGSRLYLMLTRRDDTVRMWLHSLVGLAAGAAALVVCRRHDVLPPIPAGVAAALSAALPWRK